MEKYLNTGHNALMFDNKKYYFLKSYRTFVAMYDKENNSYWLSGEYSNTTRKHIGLFAKEFGLTYYDLKNAPRMSSDDMADKYLRG